MPPDAARHPAADASPTCARRRRPRPSDDEKLESALSTAEQIGVLEDAILHSNFFGERALRAGTLAWSLVGSLARRIPEDLSILNKFWHGVVEPRSKDDGGWRAFEGGQQATRVPEVTPCSTTHARRPTHLAVAFDPLRGPAAWPRPRRSPATAQPLAEILAGLVDDVDRALREPLEIFPVCHHSPASALPMVRRLREKQPKVIYLELCEDLRAAARRAAQLPAAGGAAGVRRHVDEAFPAEWSPLSVVAPITEVSAEYQAIAYALDNPGRRAGLRRPLGGPRLPVDAAGRCRH